MDDLQITKLYETDVISRCVVRLRTTTWADKRGLHQKKSLEFLRKQCTGFNALEEDVETEGAEEVFQRILDIEMCADGIYEVVVFNEKRDYETGYVEDYDYRLVKADLVKAPLNNTHG